CTGEELINVFEMVCESDSQKEVFLTAAKTTFLEFHHIVRRIRRYRIVEGIVKDFARGYAIKCCLDSDDTGELCRYMDVKVKIYKIDSKGEHI
ncbi:hypothetical protein PMAYCL1PPCAC_20206, partial [Pristionchus mayeri]